MPLIKETVKLFERTMDRRIRIHLSLDEKVGSVEADPTQIHQLVMNLCLNARDAVVERLDEKEDPLEEGRIEIRIEEAEIGSEQCRIHPQACVGRFVRLVVSDNGIGMDEESQRHIFEPFFTTKEVGKGTGLGLATVYGIVQQHQGWIEVESAPGEGASFSVYLPRCEVDVSGEREESVPRRGLRGDETVLVVEDEQSVRDLMCRVLEGYGYSVASAGDGEEGLEKFRSGEKTDLVILDVNLPRISGKDFLARLRKMDPQVRVLICSGFLEEGLRAELTRLGAAGILDKPFLPDDLIRSVRSILDRPGGRSE